MPTLAPFNFLEAAARTRALYASAYAKAYEQVFALPAVAERNPLDPDQKLFDAVQAARGAALTYGITGNVVGQGLVVANTMTLRAAWLALQLNPMTRMFYDGKVQAP